MSEVALRAVRDVDEAFMRGVYASTREEELAPVPWSAEEKDAFLAMQFAARSSHYAQHYDGMTSDVVLVDGAAAGCLLVARWTREIRIVDIALLPAFRGRGAGSELLAELMDEATEMGKRLSIHVERENRALGLYRRLGFKPVGETGVYLRMEWDPAVAGGPAIT
jgi:ribosomal protein S18 acetylase RimI-like enzyme